MKNLYDKKKVKMVNNMVNWKPTNMALGNYIHSYFETHPQTTRTKQAERRLKREFYLSIFKRRKVKKENKDTL